MIENKTENWINYWDTENIFTDKKWQKDMEIFIKSTFPLLNYNLEDIVLDIGCGPGFLAMFLKDKVREIHCLDTSERYLNICKKRLSQEKSIFFYKIDENNYTDLSFLKTKKFTIIIMLSVIQYYKSISDVEKLIEEVRQVALPDSKFLIADIIVDNRMLSDIWSVLKTGFKEKYLLETFKYLFRSITSRYFKIRNSLGLFSVSVKELQELIKKLNLNAEILNTKLTATINRKHLLIRF
jgi:ubiquinone/menaquinone biosynthesis C-methylase UbiE